MERLKKILIAENITVKESLKRMDQTAGKILIIVEKDLVLKGVLTDGDIRRWILKGGDLNDSIEKVMNSRPIRLHEGYDQEEVKRLMVEKKIECIPIVDEKNRIVSAVWWFDIFQNKHEILEQIKVPVVIMAGGEGVRLHPFTKILPKPLIPINEKPILEIIIDRFYEYGCSDFFLSVNYKANMIKAYFNETEHPYRIEYIQEDKPLGTAGSLSLLKNKIKETFFLSNCDIIIECNYTDILKFHNKNRHKITVVASLKHYLIPYGIIEMAQGGALNAIREKPEYDFYVNTGMYVLEPDVISNISKDTVLQMPDLINQYFKAGEKVGVYPVSDKSWIDIGQWEELQSVVDKMGIK
ncbi:MAG: nucleotidyltransferase family protein [bacterium]|nr:nucleotidyltransferase family protein [bacterium]